MKYLINFSLLVAVVMLTASCGDSESHTEEDGHNHGSEGGHEEGEVEEVHITLQQFTAMEMKIDTISLRNMESYVDANGQLEVPPQNEAAVTAIIGGNVRSIKVVEGDKVRRGQVLAYLSHPDMIILQTEYASSWSQLQYLKSDYERQKKLYEEKVGSGKALEKIKSEYLSMKSRVLGAETQLRLIGLNTKKIREGKFYTNVPIVSPINGHIRLVEVKIGQYVQPHTEMFEIVNIGEIHADLMVFEKDMYKVKPGQKVKFKVQSSSQGEMNAVIYSVGKAFEQNPKALHLHAEITGSKENLIPGTFINAQISVDNTQCLSIPEAGVVKEGDGHYIFLAEKENAEDENSEWSFTPMKVILGVKENGWVELKLLEPLPSNTQIAQNNAYYLMAEMKKGEAEHTH